MVDAGHGRAGGDPQGGDSRAFERRSAHSPSTPGNQHAAVFPHLALSDRDGEFDIFRERRGADRDADPYLVHSLPRPGPVALGAPSLRSSNEPQSSPLAKLFARRDPAPRTPSIDALRRQLELLHIEVVTVWPQLDEAHATADVVFLRR